MRVSLSSGHQIQSPFSRRTQVQFGAAALAVPPFIAAMASELPYGRHTWWTLEEIRYELRTRARHEDVTEETLREAEAAGYIESRPRMTGCPPYRIETNTLEWHLTERGLACRN